MRLALLSDQHGDLPPIPECDLLVIAGDICGGPEYRDGRWRPDLSDAFWHRWLTTDFAAWVSPRQTVLIAGNHDTCIEKYGFPAITGITYLENSGVDVGDKRFWGCPYIRRFDNLAFNRTEEELELCYRTIPVATDILISHGPPHGYGDLFKEHLGSIALRSRMDRLNLQLLVCGHIHEARGTYMMHNGTRLVNTARSFTVVDI